MVYSNVYAGSPSLAQQYLRVTEIMYNPSPAPICSTNNEDMEYIELKNISSTETLDLTGVHLAEGLSFNFTGSAVTSLAPGGRVLVVKNLAAFQCRYGGGIGNIAGEYAGNLDNSGDRIRVLDASNEEILDFEYKNGWYPITDGVGFSLAIVDENAEPDLWNSKTNWRPSGQQRGEPGAPDPAPAGGAPILVNEILANTDPPLEDAIELYNATAQDVNICRWFLTENLNTPKQ